jgi:hypothetical protein
VTADLDELDASFGDQSADEPWRSAQSRGRGFHRQQ